jgi:DNA-binding MarR family transcriptional regulator
MTLEQALKTNKFRSWKHKAGLNIMYSAYWLKQHSNELLKSFGLTHEQYNVLRILKGSYPQQMCVRDIACRMIERSSNVPRIIDRLETKKLVKRSISPEDKRETLVALQQPGINMLEIVSPKLEGLYDDWVGIDEQEAEVINTLLEKMRKS